MLVLGIDEAGRGPVIGDMFIVGLIVDEGSLSHLRSLGVKDSKSLTPKAREDLLTDIVVYARFIVVTRVTPDEIDRISLNTLFRDRV
ncbi:MAG TPA: ribonuclease HII, partial [Acidilobales archaeon]|nr:ribonuclease HII [Acidilobales archaeon]